MLQPKRQKFRKSFRGSMNGLSQAGSSLNFGDFGLKALDRSWITARQIEAARKTITHHTKRVGRLWIRIFPDKTYTKKGAGVRMGGGKGEVEGYVCVVRPGRILFELAGVEPVVALESFRLAAQKLPLKTKVVTK
ncbi:MAG: 50S ribosomal protein L16 [Candidatus Beckwithbacteria bacterium GW2011_GWA2_43_10]|uniref:Large ribosomal subunit protein uL16 n=1 Tax=Candidatus Beckwithbacteria bacterium GW2011_GWA2_43_10 TaxID=1618369 RepID=A0A0G1C5C2_9BACT|nr:MAG: 50S ribosomal protein L16 [Candidatus Beckwithbacteria bacterium GW2011_GWA2_43_10]